MTEYERSLYYTDDGIRKQMPLKEKLPYILSNCMLYLDVAALYALLIKIANPFAAIMTKLFLGSVNPLDDDAVIISGIISGLVTLAVGLLVFRGSLFKKNKQLKIAAYTATYANSHDPEAWKPVYLKNKKLLLSRSLFFLLIVIVICIISYFFN